MLAEFSVIEGKYLGDILDQPLALEKTVASFTISPELERISARLQSGELKNVVLTGMGSSYHALHTLHLELVDHGVQSVMVETSELVYYQRRLFDPQTLVVAVSQSGQSAEVIRLLEINQHRSTIVAVTNTAESPLAKQAQAAIVTQAGKEFSVSCKTYIAGLAALRWLADLLCDSNMERSRDELTQVSEAVRQYLAAWNDHVLSFANALGGIRSLFVVGRGSSLAAVGTGALIIKESDRFPAEGLSCAAFRHGPFEMLSKETFVLVLAGAERTRDLNTRLVHDIRRENALAELVAEDAPFAPCRLPASAPSCQPILEILPVQMITLALAARAGREAGKFERATKITTVE